MKEYAELREQFPGRSPKSVGPNSDDGLRALESILQDSVPWDDATQARPDLPQVVKDVIYGRVQAVIDALNSGTPVDKFVRIGGSTAREASAQMTLLSVAIKAGQREVVKALLDRGANPNGYRAQAQSPIDGTIFTFPFIAPLTLAAYNGEDDVVQLLLQRGADIDATSVEDPEGGVEEYSPLMVAASSGAVSTTYLLLMHGANINSVLDEDGRLPSIISSAAVPTTIAIKDMLLAHGLKVAPDDTTEVRGD